MRLRFFAKMIVIMISAFLLASCPGDLIGDPPGAASFAQIPVVDLLVVPTSTDAVITWTTAEPATHFIEYGTAPGVYTIATLPTSTASASHTETLSGLSESTVYYFRITNLDVTLSASVGAENTFTTTGVVVTHPTPEEKLRGVWMVGGLGGPLIGSVVGGVDLYDPNTNTWYPNVTTLPTPVSFAGAVSWEDKIYVFGGFNASGTVINTVQIYNIAGDAWVAGTVMPLARANISAAGVGGKIYILGGSSSNAGAAWAGSVTTYEYTPNPNAPYSGGSWNTKTNFSAANLSDRTVLNFNDVAYNFGGRSATSTLVATHDGYAATNNGLTQGTELVLPAIRAGMSAVMYEPPAGPAVMAIAGGIATLTGTNGSFIFQGTTVGTPTSLFQFLEYPFTTPSSWKSTAPVYPLAQAFGSAALSGSHMLVFGGTANGVGAFGLSNTYRYDLSGLPAASWTARASMPAGRYGHAAVSIR